MNIEDKKNSNNWTKEERGRIVGVFEWLIKEDKKRNPDLYNPERNMVVKDKNGDDITL